jgi:predicted nucleotidyltransferase
MEESITEKLKLIETERNIRVLYAVESGSRAWGFASPDSDYDVRFIYVRPLREYLRLDKAPDAMEYELNDVMDVCGWDLDKTFRLFYKSNPTLFEWLGSPIIYKTTDEFEKHRGLFAEYYQRKHGLYHYYSMAKKNYLSNFKNDLVKLKKYFYVIRPLLACKWILEIGTPPPVLFADLAEVVLDAELKPAMDNLLMRKAVADEGEKLMKIALWDRWIESRLRTYDRAIPNAEPDSKQNWGKLNDAFWNIVSQN